MVPISEYEGNVFTPANLKDIIGTYKLNPNNIHIIRR